MADKKKLTVAEMLAAARAVDGGAAKPAMPRRLLSPLQLLEPTRFQLIRCSSLI